MSTLSLTQMAALFPKIPPLQREIYYPPLCEAMDEFEIDTPKRMAAFLAQVGHESGGLVWMREIWGPTKAQLKYEPPNAVAKRLGNTEKGDGKRFMGRGPIQLTGRANYEKYGKLLGVDLINDPDAACGPSVAFRIAGCYWDQKHLNVLADIDDFREITRRINGGYNGYDDRVRYWNRTRDALEVPYPGGKVDAGANV